jgi:hypothetical protein
MSIKDKAQGALTGGAVERFVGERPGALKAAAGAAVAGGVTSVVVFRLLRQTGDGSGRGPDETED